MALTKTTVIDKIEVLERGQLQVRTATVVAEDGVELARSYHRHGLAPGDDTTSESQLVQDVAAATWTAALVTDWQAFIAKQEPAS